MEKTHIQGNPKGEVLTCAAGVQPLLSWITCMLNGFWCPVGQGRLKVEGCSLRHARWGMLIRELIRSQGDDPQTGRQAFQVRSHLKRTTLQSVSKWQLSLALESTKKLITMQIPGIPFWICHIRSSCFSGCVREMNFFFFFFNFIWPNTVFCLTQYIKKIQYYHFNM